MTPAQNTSGSRRAVRPGIGVTVSLLLSFVLFFLVNRWEFGLLSANYMWRASDHTVAIREKSALALASIDTWAGILENLEILEPRRLRSLGADIFFGSDEIMSPAWAPLVSREELPKEKRSSPALGGCGERRTQAAPVSLIYPPGQLPVDIDLCSDPLLAPVAATAAAERRTLISPPIPTGSRNQTRYCAFIIRPVFRAAKGGADARLSGFAVGIISPGQLVEKALAPLPAAGIDIALYDPAVPGKLLHYHPSRTRPSSQQGDWELVPHGTLSHEESLLLPGRQWNLRLTAAPALYAEFAPWRSRWVLILGLLFSALLGAYLRSQRRYVTQIHDINQTLAHEIEERKRAEAVVRHQAGHDLLTGLPNRRLFLELADIALAHANRSGHSVAFLFTDLDGFKTINDRFGHEAGDRLLREIATRLRSGVRQADTVARYGGDEFAALLVDISDREAVAKVAETLLNNAMRPVILDENAQVAVGASIGIAIYPEDGKIKERLLERADAAMYEAKMRGKNQYAFWKPE